MDHQDLKAHQDRTRPSSATALAYAARDLLLSLEWGDRTAHASVPLAAVDALRIALRTDGITVPAHTPSVEATPAQPAENIADELAHLLKWVQNYCPVNVQDEIRALLKRYDAQKG